MNLIKQYATWLDEEIAARKREDEGSPALGGLILAQYGLRMLLESRPVVMDGHCGVISYSPSGHSMALCMQDEGHHGPHSEPPL